MGLYFLLFISFSWVQSMWAERSGPICRSVAQAVAVASRSTLRSTLRPFFKGRSPLRSAPTNFLAAPMRVGTTHEGHLPFGGLHHCAKFGWNRCSFLIICMFFDFASLAWKRLFTPQNWGFWPPKWGAMWKKNPQKAHPCASPRRLNHHAWKSVDASDL